MDEFKSNVVIKSGSEKSFGVVFSLLLLFIGIYLYISAEIINYWLLGGAFILLLLAYLAPQVLTIPNNLWFKLGLGLGAIFVPIVISFVYFVTVVPVGVMARLLGKDLINQKIDKSVKSYWIVRKQPVGSMKDQF